MKAEQGLLARDFFDLVRQIESESKARAGVGRSARVADEVVRFSSSIQLASPVHDVERIQIAPGSDGGQRFRLTVTFLGLTGVTSPLPGEYLREILEDEHTGETPVRDFLDIFHHRAISLFFRAGVKYRPYLDGDPDAQAVGTRFLLAVGGTDVQAIARPGDAGDAADARSRVPFIGALARRVRSPGSIAMCASEALGGAPVDVESFLLRRVPVPEDQAARLGAGGPALGSGVILGETAPDRAGRCGVIVGPVPLDLFQRLVPGTPEWERLERALALSIPPWLEYQLVTVLDRDAVPEPTLGGSLVLGQVGWLGQPSPEDLRVPHPPQAASSIVSRRAPAA